LKLYDGGMSNFTRLTATLTLALGLTHAAAAAQHPSMPAGMSHAEHLAQMEKDAALKERGARAMGFDQDKATHHFRLDRTGGAIEVVADDLTDQALSQQIRTHLESIAKEFAAGDFGKPLATHAELPPGTSIMRQQRRALAFVYEELPGGGRVRITASNARATDAVHRFLRYQIREHKTGDAMK
jgi:hypothetical protein